MGARKLEQFSDVFLSAVAKFAKKNKIFPIDIPAKRQDEKVIKIRTLKPMFYLKTKELLLKRILIERIAKHQDIQPSAVINHIEKLIDAGEKLDLGYLKLPADRYAIMKAAFEECGDEKLKPVFEYLKEKYSYDELRLVRVLMRV